MDIQTDTARCHANQNSLDNTDEHMDTQTDKAKCTKVRWSVKHVNQEYRDLLKFKFHNINRYLIPEG